MGDFDTAIFSFRGRNGVKDLELDYFAEDEFSNKFAGVEGEWLEMATISRRQRLDGLFLYLLHHLLSSSAEH